MRLWTVLWGGGGREDFVEVWKGLLDGWIGRSRWGGGEMEGQEGG